MTLPDSTSDRRADTRKLLLACAVCVVFMVIEIVGGVLSNSLAIATDALHLLSDVSSFLISAIMLIMAQRETTKIHTYGFHRAEVCAIRVLLPLTPPSPI